MKGFRGSSVLIILAGVIAAGAVILKSDRVLTPMTSAAGNDKATQPQAFGLEQKLVDPTRESNARLGSSVAIGPDFALVGTPLDDVGANQDQGSVLFYTRTGSTWTFQQRITASDGAASDKFGENIALSGDTLVVGLPVDTIGGNGSQGSVYVYTRSGTVWTEQQKLTAVDGASGDNLGAAVAIDGDTLIAGAFGHDLPASNQGAVYVFIRSGSTWSQQQKLTSSDGVSTDQFGEQVDISGDSIVVGVPRADIGPPPTPNIDQGAAYVFTRSAGVWTQQQKILGPASEDAFAETVTIDGDTVALTNPNSDDGSIDFIQGAVYVFTRSGSVWTQQQTLRASDRYFGDRFGNSLDLSGDKLLVGASLANIAAVIDQGAAYVFARSGGVWTEQKKLFASDGEGGDQFGHHVAMNGQDVIVGALFESSTGGTNQYGAAYVFSDAFATAPSECAWTNDVRYPINIQDEGVAAHGSRIFSFGGLSNGTATANSYKFDGDRWTAIAPLPVALDGPTVVSDGTFLYIAGGLNAANNPVNTLYRYDPALDTYTPLLNVPSSTWASGGALIGGKFYKIGGWTTLTGGPVNTVSAYDIATNTWSPATNYPVALGWVSAAVDGGMIYSGAGHNGTIPSAKTYRYDPVGNSWNDAAVADLPSVRYGSALAFHNGSLIIAGGNIGGTTAEVLRLDTATNTWGTVVLAPNLYRAGAFMAGAVLGNEFHIIGGSAIGFNGTRDHFKLVCGDALNPVPGCSTPIAYTDPPVAIPDNSPAGVNIPINVSGIGTVTDLDFRFDGTYSNTATSQGVDHTNIGDLIFTLTSPAGTSLTFINRISRTTTVGGCDRNHLSQLLLNDDAILPIDVQCSENNNIRPGSYSPGDKFSVFNGQLADGVWNLNVSDNRSGTTGNVRRFTLLFGRSCSTAAGVTISGRVMSPDGRGIRAAGVELRDASGTSRTVRTGGRGMFQFDNVAPGQTYTLSASARRYSFSPLIVDVTDNLTGLDLKADGK